MNGHAQVREHGRDTQQCAVHSKSGKQHGFVQVSFQFRKDSSWILPYDIVDTVSMRKCLHTAQSKQVRYLQAGYNSMSIFVIPLVCR